MPPTELQSESPITWEMTTSVRSAADRVKDRVRGMRPLDGSASVLERLLRVWSARFACGRTAAPSQQRPVKPIVKKKMTGGSAGGGGM